ncbi:MFS transporter [Rhodovarius crocodyli]|uniref:MFS transporter n=1 Tax=Rhodovarius crocodyli TaxID=1979269 RepID=A0A437MCF8_9PROT|nr:MFS transporter [Rhodovarius crocodyli]RVT95305.1 MFS transporter [Rhodovarius crocodyli]
MKPETRAVIALGLGQTLAWGGSYYVPAILAAPMAAELGVPTSLVFGVFSAALVLAALVGPWAGRAIDRHGGHGVLVASNLILALGLAALAFAQGPVTLTLGWLAMGLGMGLGLYESAFAALARLFGKGARAPITGITLIAGFASTVAWPVSTWLEARYGWRVACLSWAGAMLVLGPLLNGLLLPRPAAPVAAAAGAATAEPAAARPGWVVLLLLGFVFAVSGFGASALAAHLPGLLAAAGATPATVVAAGALLGPAQVAARLLEFGLLRKLDPVLNAMMANMLPALGAAVLLGLGAPGAVAYAMLHGAGNGMLTIARGTLPLALFGPAGYGNRAGWLSIGARFAGAAAPLLFGLAVVDWGAWALLITSALYVGAAAALLGIRLVIGRTAG